MRVLLLALLLGTGVVQAAEPPAEPVLRIETGVHQATINQAAVTRDGRLLTVADDKTARLWPVGGGDATVLRVPVGPRNEGALYAVAASPSEDLAVVAGWTGVAWDGAGAVYAFDLKTGALSGRLAGLPGPVHALRYSRDGRYLAIGSETGGLRVIDRPAKAVALDDRNYGGTVTALLFLGDGRLVTAAKDGKIRLYDARLQLSATHTLPERRRPFRLAAAPDGGQIAVGNLDAPVVDILAVDGLQPRRQLTGAAGTQGAFSVVAWIGTTVYATGTYGDAAGVKLRAWDGVTGTAQEAVVAADSVMDAVVLPDGRLALTTAEPAVVTVDPHHLQATVRQPRATADFRDAFLGTFSVARDGAAVDFGLDQGGRNPVRFDLNDRSLTRDPPLRADLSKPVVPRTVQNWRNALRPEVGGKAVVLDENEFARAVAGNADGMVVLLGSDYSLRLLRGRLPAWKVNLPAPAWAVNLSGDGRFALAALGDGTIRWFNTADGAEVLALFAARDGRWIVWTPEGFFDHSDGVADLIGYHINRGKAVLPEFVRSGQIHETFFRPDLVSRKFQGADIASATAQTGDAKTVVVNHVAPDVRLLAWCVGDRCSELGGADTRGSGEQQTIAVNVPEVTLRIAVADRGSGVGKIVVRRNAAAVATRSIGVRTESGVRIENRTVALEPGDNPITISAYDANRSLNAGQPIRLLIRYAATAVTDPALHVLSIGINRYRNPEINELNNAVNDARGLVELMGRTQQGLFSAGRTWMLLDDQATRAGIETAFGELAAHAKPDDAVLVFLAGHGVALDGRYYFLPYDTGAWPQSGQTGPDEQAMQAAIKATGLTQDRLADLISALPTARTAILIDSCYAGAFAVPDAVLRQSQDRTWVGALGQNTGRFVLAGTTNAQEALDGVGGHGVFTAVVLEGLRGRADQQFRGNRDHRVDIVELSQYAKQRVPEEAQKIDPNHLQKATGFFAGSDFFELSAVASGP